MTLVGLDRRKADLDNLAAHFAVANFGNKIAPPRKQNRGVVIRAGSRLELEEPSHSVLGHDLHRVRVARCWRKPTGRSPD
jgi:hypothetical protein